MRNSMNAVVSNDRAERLMRRPIAATALLAAVAFSLSAPAGASEAPAITVNGAPSAQGVQRGNMLFVPSSSVFKQIGTSVTYKAPNAVVATKAGAELVRMTVGSRKAVVKGGAQTLATAPFMQAGQVMVPLRLISEAAGASVTYSASPRSVAVNETHAAAAMTGATTDAAATGAAAGAASVATAATAAPVADTQTQAGIPWWVWLLAALVILGIIFALMRRKKNRSSQRPAACAAPNPSSRRGVKQHQA